MMKRMINPAEVSQYQDIPLPENREITAQLPKYKIKEPTLCNWINTKGRNVGGECGKVVTEGSKWCAGHKTVDLMNKAKESKSQEIKMPVLLEEPESEDFEEIEVPSAPHPTPFMLPQQAQEIDGKEKVLSVLDVILILSQMKLR